MTPLMKAKEAFVEFEDDHPCKPGDEFKLAVMSRCYFRAEPFPYANDDIEIVRVEVGARPQPWFSTRKWDTATACIWLVVHLRAKRTLSNYKLKVPGKCIPSLEKEAEAANRSAGRDLRIITFDNFEKLEEPINVGEVIKPGDAS